MGSTAAVAAICEDRLYIANVGDSQIYLVRGNDIAQLTVDHTWGNEMVRQGTLTLEEAARHPERGDLMRSIGYEPQVHLDEILDRVAAFFTSDKGRM
jgi:protein phosphatase